MVPLKSLAEAVGATYHWDVKKKQITLQKWAEPLVLKERSRKNQQQLTFEVVSEEVYIPLRDVSLDLGYTLEKFTTGWGDSSTTFYGRITTDKKKNCWVLLVIR